MPFHRNRLVFREGVRPMDFPIRLTIVTTVGMEKNARDRISRRDPAVRRCRETLGLIRDFIDG